MSAVFAIGTVSVNGYGRRPAMLSDGRVFILDEVSSYCAGRGIALPPATSVLELLERWDDTVEACAALSAEIAAGHLAKFARRESEIRIHAPHEPRQVFCTGANYHRHVVDIIVDRFGEKKMREEGLTKDELRQWAEDLMTKRAETGQPYIFTRIASSYAGPFDDLVIPAFSQEPDWEAELAVVFKRGGHNIPRAEALSHVAGYMVVNDITSRDQIYTADPAELGADWLHAKNSPGFFPMGPWIVPARFVADPHNLRITLKLNGEIMQDEPTSDMIFDIPTQIAVLSKYARIIAGDVLATGSPAGNGTHYNRYLKPGDVVEASVEGLGTQTVRCVAAD